MAPLLSWDNRPPKPREKGKTMMIDFGPDDADDSSATG